MSIPGKNRWEAAMTLMIDASAFANAAPLWSRPATDSATLIRVERPSDVAARETLLDDAFGPTRFAKTCERLREDRMPTDGLALVAMQGERLVGTIRLWHVDAGGVPALLLGPVAVANDLRSEGLGRKLIIESLSRAMARGHRAVILVGDAPYYQRFGFERAHTLGLQLPGPVDVNRFLGLELDPGALKHAQGLVSGSGAFEYTNELALRLAA